MLTYVNNFILHKKSANVKILSLLIKNSTCTLEQSFFRE